MRGERIPNFPPPAALLQRKKPEKSWFLSVLIVEEGREGTHGAVSFQTEARREVSDWRFERRGLRGQLLCHQPALRPSLLCSSIKHGATAGQWVFKAGFLEPGASSRSRTRGGTVSPAPPKRQPSLQAPPSRGETWSNCTNGGSL